MAARYEPGAGKYFLVSCREAVVALGIYLVDVFET